MTPVKKPRSSRVLVEELADGLVRWGYATARFCSKEEAAALCAEAAALEMAPGMVTTGAGSQRRASDSRGDEVAWIQDASSATLASAVEELRRLGASLGPALARSKNRGVRAPQEVASVLARCAARRGDATILADRGPAAKPPAMVSRYRAGRPGFRPHVDASATTELGARPDPRVVSAVLYLNDVPKQRGGSLRLWRPGLQAAHRQHHSDLSVLDVPPTAGMLVVFWSAIVLHEVKPLLRGPDRFALSVWFNEPHLPTFRRVPGNDDDRDDDDDDDAETVVVVPGPEPRSIDREAQLRAVATTPGRFDGPPPPPPSTPESQLNKKNHFDLGTASAPPPASRKRGVLTTPAEPPARPPFPVFEAE
eukprot:CAMPEP_0198651676 /NCGR_PEP_ID=MMETSP1467-20131203/5852_1 /TAXON_ID=1462469 /ORGANISM="unid. sp., Strain CCMP2135" /LENGTH=364 /DNA_ID=CAMNT_0044387577 /DNA_START=40 /DNA_END=1134 /DNA_ORIENTATION=-